MFHWCWSFSGEWITMLSKWCHEHQHISAMPGHKCDQIFTNTLPKEFVTKFTALKWPHLVCHCYSPFEKAIHLDCCFPTVPQGLFPLLLLLFFFNCLCLFKCLLTFSPTIFLFICLSPLFVCMDLMTSSYANWVNLLKSKCLINKK